MIVYEDHASGSVRKVAVSDSERHRLGRERSILEALAHPGVVHLIARASAGEQTGVDHRDGPVEQIVLARVGGGTLAKRSDLSVEEVAGIGAALATTLGDIHRLGYAHLDVTPAHILLDEVGRPVLCGFGRAEALAERDPRAAAECRRADLRGLTDSLLSCCPGEGRARIAKALRRSGRSSASDCRAAAKSLVRSVPGARLPGETATPATRATPRAPAPRRRRRLLLVGAAVAVAGTAGLLVVPHAFRETGADAAPSGGCRLVHGRSCPGRMEAVEMTAGGRVYKLAFAGHLETFVARWDCAVTPLPIALDPRDGEVWAFGSWPGPKVPVVGRLVAALGPATGASVIAGRDGCDALWVRRSGSGPVEVEATMGTPARRAAVERGS
jgi:hypothetical protein